MAKSTSASNTTGPDNDAELMRVKEEKAQIETLYNAELVKVDEQKRTINQLEKRLIERLENENAILKKENEILKSNLEQLEALYNAEIAKVDKQNRELQELKRSNAGHLEQRDDFLSRIDDAEEAIKLTQRQCVALEEETKVWNATNLKHWNAIKKQLKKTSDIVFGYQ
jgi:chromosome segregation ATPase